MIPYTIRTKRLLLLLPILPTIFFIIICLIYYPHIPFFSKSFDEKFNKNGIRIAGSFVEYTHPVSSNRSYCTFNYGLPWTLNFSEKILEYGPELDRKSVYRVLYNAIEGKVSTEIPPVTYATHVTVDFVNYIPELARLWEGHISVAAFVSDTDIIILNSQLTQLCHCVPQMSRVSVHFVFHYKVPPSVKNVLFSTPKNCKIPDSSKLLTYRNLNDSTIYPINVCRNVARTGAITEYVLVSDVQLMPSEGLASRFLEMIYNYQFSSAQYPSRIFVVPVFEVEMDENVPKIKEDLVKMVREERAVYFHRHVCTHCQKFPGLEGWLDSNHGNSVVPLITVKREVPYNRWEPIYIGTKYEPYYNEVLSWEGLQDKMLQMLEMCLLGYRFVILDGAFLVHWPGMKKGKKKNIEKWRIPFVRRNTRQYNKILKKLSTNYTPNNNCKLQ